MSPNLFPKLGIVRLSDNLNDDLLGERITLDEHVTFLVRYSDFKRAGTGYICSLSGEFLKDGKKFEPARTYTLTNVQVMTDDIASLVRPMYSAGEILSRSK